MKLTLPDTTPEQDEALVALNLLSNPKLQPPIEEFAISELVAHLDSLVVKQKQTDLSAAQVKLTAVIAIAEKYAN